MWWLLTYAAYGLLASAAVGATTYVAVTRFAVLQRLLATALERWMRQIAANEDGTSTRFSVWHTSEGARVPLFVCCAVNLTAVGTLSRQRQQRCLRTCAGKGTCLPAVVNLLPSAAAPSLAAGVEATGLTVGSRVLRLVHSGGEQLAAASVEQLQLIFPTFSRPLTARIVGVRVQVQQVKLPKVRRWQGPGRAWGQQWACWPANCWESGERVDMSPCGVNTQRACSCSALCLLSFCKAAPCGVPAFCAAAVTGGACGPGAGAALTRQGDAVGGGGAAALGVSGGSGTAGQGRRGLAPTR